MKMLCAFVLMLVICGFAFGQAPAQDVPKYPLQKTVPGDYPTIQAAITALSDGWTIMVDPGTYVENVDFQGKAIDLLSKHGLDVTCIDGNQAGSVITMSSGEGSGARLSGFTIQNGSAVNGGGLYVYNASAISSPVISNCRFESNTTSTGNGGGVYMKDCTSTIKRCSFIDNTMNGLGGGFYGDNYDGYIINCLFWWNYSYRGAGCFFDNNCSVYAVNSTYIRNFAGNAGGGCYVNNESSIVNVINCIFWMNRTNWYDYQLNSLPGTPIVQYTCIEGGWVVPGLNNTTTDPQLYGNTLTEDYHLMISSPCKDSGWDATSYIQKDLDGDPRKDTLNMIVDRGADEYSTHLYSIGDVVPGGTVTLGIVGFPGWPVTVYEGDALRTTPQSTQYGNWWLQNTVNTWSPGMIDAAGIMYWTFTVPTSWTTGSLHPFQVLVGNPGYAGSQYTNYILLMP